MNTIFKIGDIVYLLGRYTPDGEIRVVECEIVKIYKNGNMTAYAVGKQPGEFTFNKKLFNACFFRTRNEASLALFNLNLVQSEFIYGRKNL